MPSLAPKNVTPLPPPACCSAGYREGWEAAEDWVRYGGPITSEADLHPEALPLGMTEEQTAGFRARLMKELDPGAGQVLAFRPRSPHG